MRYTDKELEEAILTLNHQLKDTGVTKTFYDYNGDETKDRKKACAILVKFSNNEKIFHIMVNTDRDPYKETKAYLEESIMRSKALRKSDEIFKFISVDKNTFEEYLSFLRTKNNIHYNLTKRGI